MPIRLMSGLPARIVQVLQDYLPAELDLIDAEEADGVTTPDIDAGDYYQWDRQAIPEFPACTVRTLSSIPIEVRPLLMGTRIDARHRIELGFHCTLEQAGGDPLVLQKLMHRYVAGAIRVLAVTNEALQTVADPTRVVEIVEWIGEATYGPLIDQEDGADVRSATVPLEVRRREER